jgi:hypothetical protein
VVDAAGAIYVIGGYDGFATFLRDVWVSTDGGARPDSVNGLVGGYIVWVLQVLSVLASLCVRASACVRVRRHLWGCVGFVHGFLSVCVRARICVRLRARVYAYMHTRACLCMRAFVCARACVLDFHR